MFQKLLVDVVFFLDRPTAIVWLHSMKSITKFSLELLSGLQSKPQVLVLKLIVSLMYQKIIKKKGNTYQTKELGLREKVQILFFITKA